MRGALVVALALLALAANASAAGATTFTVTTTADSASGTCPPAGPCTLRQAITSAGEGDTITVPAGTYDLDPANGQLDVGHGVTIDGAGPATTTIVGDGSHRVMLINGNSTTATLSGLTITGGTTIQSAGGGLAAAGPGPVVLDDVTVTGNSATPSAAGFGEGGGGIFSLTTLTLDGSTVSHNTVTVGASDGDSGGAGILMAEEDSDLTLDDSTVSGNTATVTADVGGPTNTDNNGGGGIYNDGLDLALTDSTVSGNTVTVNGAVQSEPADGGGGVYQFGNNMRLQDSTISGNVAHGPGIDKGGGGGVFDDGNTSEYLNSTIADNRTDVPASAGTPDTDGGGGVLFDSVFGGVAMANMTITGNSASAAAGGAINNNLDSTIEVTDSIIAANTASAGTGANCDTLSQAGDEILSEGFNLTDDSSCGFSPATDDVITSAIGLGPLRDNGGPTETEALLAGSRAIDAGDPSGCTDLVGDALTTDQRGVSRPQPPGGRCDIGAYERALPIVSTSNAAVTGTTVLFGAMVGNPDPRAGTIRFEYGPTTNYGSTTTAQPLPAELGRADVHRLGIGTGARHLPLPCGRDESGRDHARARPHLHDRCAAATPATAAPATEPVHAGSAGGDGRQGDSRRCLHGDAQRDRQPRGQGDHGRVPVRHHDQLRLADDGALGRLGNVRGGRERRTDRPRAGPHIPRARGRDELSGQDRLDRHHIQDRCSEKAAQFRRHGQAAGGLARAVHVPCQGSARAPCRAQCGGRVQGRDHAPGDGR